MQPIRVSRSVGFDRALAPDAEAVLKGIETELIWRGNHTVRLTPGEYVFRGPGVARTLLPDGGPTTWLVRGGRISFAMPQWSLRVQLDLDPVSLFLVPLGVAAVLARFSGRSARRFRGAAIRARREGVSSPKIPACH